MGGTFFGVEIARRGLSAARHAMDVTGHNLANAATPGYSRQEPVLTPTAPYTPPTLQRPARPLQLGTGVQVETVRRVRDEFLDLQVRLAAGEKAYYEAERAALEQAEALFSEPGDYGIQAALAKFWDAWQELAENPTSLGVRAAVVGAGEQLASLFRRTREGLVALQKELVGDPEAGTVADTGTRLAVAAEEANRILAELATLNREIVRVRSMEGASPNDLLDRRDLLLDRLAALGPVSWEEDGPAAGVVSVDFFGVRVLDGTRALEEDAALTLDAAWLEEQYRAWLAGGGAAEQTGRVGGLLAAYDAVGQTVASLDELASALAQAVNDLHRQGYTLSGSAGGDFFAAASRADELAVVAELSADPSLVAAAATPSPGDGEQARAIAALRRTALATLGGRTADAAYQQLVGVLGAARRTAADQEQAVGLWAEQANAFREAVKGVSVDEELTRLMQYQFQYQAAARFLAVLDECLDTLVNRLR